MTNHAMLMLIPVAMVALGALYFFRTNRGVKLVEQLKPKPNLKSASSWTIGPVTGQGNQSLNMPLHPVAVQNGLLLDMPNSTCQPHYVTVDYGSLTGKSKITLTVEAQGGPFFAKDGASQATICLYFQRVWDDWSATVGADTAVMADQNQNTQYYRWFATATGSASLAPGTITLSANLSDKWTALRAESEDSLNPNEGARYFKAAVDSAGAVGFVLGGGDGWGHGVMSPNPSKITILSLDIT